MLEPSSVDGHLELPARAIEERSGEGGRDRRGESRSAGLAALVEECPCGARG